MSCLYSLNGIVIEASTTSGGQKVIVFMLVVLESPISKSSFQARVSLARAVYSKAAVVLADDVRRFPFTLIVY